MNTRIPLVIIVYMGDQAIGFARDQIYRTKKGWIYNSRTIFLELIEI